MAVKAGSGTSTESKRVLAVGAASIVVVFAAMLLTVGKQTPRTPGWPG